MMESTFTLLRVRGIPIGVHWSWLLVFAIVVWSLARGLFPATYPDLDGSVYVAMAVVTAAAFFGSVLLHELGHALRAVKEGVPIEGITLWLLGGVARLGGSPTSPGAEFRVAIFGPLVTVALAAGALGAATAGDALNWPDAVQGVIDYLARINVLVLGFNLVPALPLDGGRVLRSWLWHRQGSFTAATRSAARAGQAFGFTLIAIGLLGLFGGTGLGGIWFAFLGWFLVQAAQSEVMTAQVRWALSGTRVRDIMSPEPVVARADMSVGDLVEREVLGRHFSTFPVVDGDHPVGVVSLRAAAMVPEPERATRRVADIMMPLEEVPAVSADDGVVDVLPRLEGVTKRALVVDDGRLVGVLSVSDVARAVDLGAARRPPEPARRAGPLVWLVVGLAILIAAAALYHPPYVVLTPGEATDVVEDISITGVPVTDVEGEFLLTSVRLSQPSALRLLVAAIRPDRDVLSLSSVVPRGVGADEYSRRQRAMFDESRMVAAAAAARAVGLPVTVSGRGARVVDITRDSPVADDLQVGDVIVAVDGQSVSEAAQLSPIISSRPADTSFSVTVQREGRQSELRLTSRRLPELAGGVGFGIAVETEGLRVELPFEISFKASDVGGSSAGLAYGLAIADLLSDHDYARDRIIASTGTIDPDGEVGPVGGVEQKAITAEDAGATLFLVPDREVAQVDGADVTVRGVDNLQEALEALAA